MTNAIRQQHYQTLITSRSTRAAQRATLRRRNEQAAYPDHLTPAQRDWLMRFQSQTNIELLHLAELQAGHLSFHYVATTNLRHFERWFRDTMNTITHDIPQDEDQPSWLDRLALAG